MKTLVSLLKGRVTVLEAESGSGSVFEVTLPGRQLTLPDSDQPESRSRVSELVLSGQEKSS